MKKLFLLLVLILFAFIPNKVFAVNEVNIYLFYSDTCDICTQEKAYLEALKQRYPNIRVYQYEVTGNTKNNELMARAKQMYNKTSSGVPFTVIGDSAFLGFSQNSKAIFQKRVYEYSKSKYENKLGQVLGISYRTDLEGEVVEYKDNQDYQIEEPSGNVRVPVKDEDEYDKNKVTIYLVGSGFGLLLVAGIIYMIERKR